MYITSNGRRLGTVSDGALDVPPFPTISKTHGEVDVRQGAREELNWSQANLHPRPVRRSVQERLWCLVTVLLMAEPSLEE